MNKYLDKFNLLTGKKALGQYSNIYNSHVLGIDSSVTNSNAVLLSLLQTRECVNESDKDDDDNDDEDDDDDCDDNDHDDWRSN